MSSAARRLFHTFTWKVAGAYAKNPTRAAEIEQIVRQDAAKAGGADSRGAHTAICTTEHETLDGDRRNHVTVEYKDKDNAHITTHHVLVPKKK